jgi:hypothetical protein
MADEDIPHIWCTTEGCELFEVPMDASGIPGIPVETVWCGRCMEQSLVVVP